MNGSYVHVAGSSSFGGEAASLGFIIEFGNVGAWKMNPGEGLSIPAGYYHLTTLVVESIADLDCDIQTIALNQGKVLVRRRPR